IGSASGGGSACLLHANGTLLNTFTNPASPPGYGFGSSVAAVGSDGVLLGGSFGSSNYNGAVYLFKAAFYNPGLIAENVRPGSITTGSLADGAVTTAKIGGVLAAGQLPDLDASKITSGTLANARLSANVPMLDGTNVFTATNQFTGPIVATNAGS